MDARSDGLALGAEIIHRLEFSSILAKQFSIIAQIFFVAHKQVEAMDYRREKFKDVNASGNRGKT